MAERSIVDIGRFLQAGALRVKEHSAFGGVSPGAHSPRGYHPHDEAIDVTDWSDAVTDGQDWRARTRARRDRFAQLGLSEVLGPGDKGHDTHLHLALKGKKFLSDQMLLWARDGRYQDAQGRWQTGMPGMQPGAGQTMASVGSTVVTDSVVEAAKPQTAKPPPPPQPMDWKPAVSDPGRSTDPSSQAYWQRQDMKLWAQANPALARATMARAGADASWLETPAMQTPAAPASQTPASQTPAPAAAAPAAPAPVAPAPVAPAPVAPKPEDRGALNGTQVGGPPPERKGYTGTWAQGRQMVQAPGIYGGRS
jgi:hypothetical protein